MPAASWRWTLKTAEEDEVHMSATLHPVDSAFAVDDGVEEVVLTPEGYARLEDEYRRLTAVARPEAAARLGQALQVAGDLADNPEYLDARNELDLVEQRIERIERRLHAARVLRNGDLSNDVVSLGSRVVLEDLDDRTCEEYVLVSSAESNPAEGRLSSESPVGRAIRGHHRGEVVDARTPRRVRHLRIAEVGGRR
jgi:transcription elongation factor GreA